jgi:hypothetical protein
MSSSEIPEPVCEEGHLPQHLIRVCITIARNGVAEADVTADGRQERQT